MDKDERRKRDQEQIAIIRNRADRAVEISDKLKGDPDKQFVRRNAWLAVIQDYAQKRREAGITDELKYLTMPGPNAIDVGLLYRAGILDRVDDGFPALYICDESSAEQVQAKLGTLGGFSKLYLHEEFQEVNKKAKLPRSFPLDVINIDMQNPLVSVNAKQNVARLNLDALRHIIRLQRGQAFLLLLTSLPEESARDYLVNIVVENLDQENFRQKYEERYGGSDIAACLADYTNFTQIAVPKMLARVAKHLGYAVHQHFVGRYAREMHDGRDAYDYTCHSFEFEPLGRTGQEKYKPRWNQVTPDDVEEELKDATRRKALDAYAEFVASLLECEPLNIGVLLKNDIKLKAELTAEALSLEGWWEAFNSGDEIE